MHLTHINAHFDFTLDSPEKAAQLTAQLHGRKPVKPTSKKKLKQLGFTRGEIAELFKGADTPIRVEALSDTAIRVHYVLTVADGLQMTHMTGSNASALAALFSRKYGLPPLGPTPWDQQYAA